MISSPPPVLHRSIHVHFRPYERAPCNSRSEVAVIVLQGVLNESGMYAWLGMRKRAVRYRGRQEAFCKLDFLDMGVLLAASKNPDGVGGAETTGGVVSTIECYDCDCRECHV